MMYSEMIDRLLNSLEGRLPYMNKIQKHLYEKVESNIRGSYYIYNHFLETNIEKEKREFVIQNFNNYSDDINYRNSILNDLYYKDGIRDGINLFIECIKKLKLFYIFFYLIYV